MSKQRTLTMRDRQVLAQRWEAGDGAVNIAVELGFSPAAIYQELKRGSTGELDQNKRMKYDPEKGQAVYQANLRNRGRRPAARK